MLKKINLISVLTLALIISTGVLLPSCIFVEEDDDHLEIIYVENRTHYNNIKFYLDDVFMGWVGAYSTSEFRGNFVGTHNFYAETQSGAVYWEDTYYIGEDDVFTWILEYK